MLVCRRRTKSQSLWVQICGRLLRTIGGNITTSIAAGKSDGLLLDFAGNVDEFGPLDFIQPRPSSAKLVSCESCGKRNPSAAARCWSCDDTMTKNCPACLEPIAKGLLDCPHCGHDMRTGGGDERKPQKLFETPTGAALISSWARGTEREGGWLPVKRIIAREDGTKAAFTGDAWRDIGAAFSDRVTEARWLRVTDGGDVIALLVPHGGSRTIARQISADGSELVVPLPAISC